MHLPGFHDLLRRAQAGDRPSMEKILAAVRPQLEKLAREHADLGCAAESASDTVQETELRAWQKLSQFEGGSNDEETFALFNGWIGQIVRRLSLDGHRNRSTQRRSPARPIVPLEHSASDKSNIRGGKEPPSSESTPSAKARTREGESKVHAALEALSDPTDREIVRLYFFEAFSLHQISDRLGIAYDRVKDRYRRAMGHLEKDLRSLL